MVARGEEQDFMKGNSLNNNIFNRMHHLRQYKNDTINPKLSAHHTKLHQYFLPKIVNIIASPYYCFHDDLCTEHARRLSLLFLLFKGVRYESFKILGNVFYN